jgi:ABC-2 type transport system permease protein
MSTVVLYGTLLRRSLIEFRRYAFDTVSGLISIYGFFLVIFFGAKIFGGDQAGFGEDIEGIVVSYGMWAITMFALGSLTYDLTQEAQLGTLEQLGMSPFGLVRVLVARAFTSLASYVVMWAALLVLMMATTGHWLNIDVVSVVPLLAVTIVGVVGVGFLLASLAIVFKRVQQALQVYQVLFIGLVVVPPDEVPVMKYLPLSWGTHLISRVMVQDVSIFSMAPGDLLFLVANSLTYFFVGVAVFKRFERAARERGLLGHY